MTTQDQVIPPHAAVEHDDLTPGRVVERWTDQTSAGVFVPLPCHEAQAVKLDPHDHGVVVICRVCTESYTAELTPDSDGGYTAQLVVTYVPFLLSRARRAS